MNAIELPRAGEPQYAVELRDICKAYPGSARQANSHINLNLKKGEILCIAGENGAGKTTLMKILAGLEQPEAGEIFINGRSVVLDTPETARKQGIGMVHQRFMLFPEYTVAENMVMGIEPRKWGIFCDTAKAKALAAKVIRDHHFSIKPDRPVHSLTVGEMQQTEICRLLFRNADVIILDEPTSVLTERETNALFKTLKGLALEGKSLFLITHKLHEIKRLSDRVAVLRGGELVGERNTADIDEYEIAGMMIGPLYANNRPVRRAAAPAADSSPVIGFEQVTILRPGQERPLLDSVSFTVRKGEILGFAGVGGNGLGVIEAALGGFLHPASGTITHRGRDISRLNTRRLRNQGLAYVPADRLRVGCAPGAGIDENLMIDRRREFTRFGFLDTKAIRKFSNALAGRYNISGGGNRTAFLSGGNLQKLVLAREIDQCRDYIVFSEPAWGLDIAARNFVWEEIERVREKGAAVILISTDLDEALALADRIIVMYQGRAAGEFVNNREPCFQLTLKEQIGACMQGLVQNTLVLNTTALS